MPCREEYQEYKNEMATYCCHCSGALDFKRPVVQSTEGEYAHVTCSIRHTTHQCTECGLMVGDVDKYDEEDGCMECGGKLVKISKAQASRQLQRTTLADADPEIYDIDEEAFD